MLSFLSLFLLQLCCVFFSCLCRLVRRRSKMLRRTQAETSSNHIDMRCLYSCQPRLSVPFLCARALNVASTQAETNQTQMASAVLVQMPAGDVGDEATAYREVTLASEIARELLLAGFLGASEALDIEGLCLDEGLLEAAGFEAFATFRTNREKYRYERGVFVVSE